MVVTRPLLLVAVLVLLAAVATAAWLRRSRRTDKAAGGSLPVAHLARVRALPRYQRLARRQVTALSIGLVGTGLLCLGAAVLAGQPISFGTQQDATSNRDIVLCLDVSGSMTETNRQVIQTYLELAQRLNGERIGLVLFDATAVTVFPLTNDAVFIEEHVSAVEEQLGRVIPGTRVEGVGTSLIGDGVVSCLQRFDSSDAQRSRTIVLATDNQLAGSPLFTLPEAGSKSEEQDVMVFAVVPGDNSTSATEELRGVVRATGGDVLLLTPERSREVGVIEEAVRSQERRTLDAAAGARWVADPLPGALLCLAGLGIVLGSRLLARRRPGGWRRASTLRRVATPVLVAALVLQPALGGDAQAAREGTDIVLVVDRTTSMGAQDFDGDNPRLQGVAQDVATLVAQHPDASYTVISVDDEARVALPWSTDALALRTLAETIGWRESAYGSGSDIGAGAELAQRQLERAAEQHPQHDRYLVYLGDGEQTGAGEPSSFEEVAPLVTDALVLGYGTTEGGVMSQRPHSDELVLYGDEPATSRMDPQALQTIADQLDGTFLARSSSADEPEFWPRHTPEAEPAETPPAVSPTWLLGLLLVPLVAWELWHGVRVLARARKELQA